MGTIRQLRVQQQGNNNRRAARAGGGEEPVDPNIQLAVFDPDNVPIRGTGVLSNNDTTWAGEGANYSDAVVTTERSWTTGGKYIFEMTCDSYSGSYPFHALGFFDPAGPVGHNYAGTANGGAGCLFTYGVYSRVYHSALDNVWSQSDPTLYLGASGVGDVITMAINLDDAEVTWYINGETTGTWAVDRGTGGDGIKVYCKPYGIIQMTINPTILYPVDGYVAFA